MLLDDGRYDKPYYTYINYQNSNRYTLSITGQNKLIKWWSINSDFNIRYVDYSLNNNYNVVLPKPDFVYSGKLTNSFKFWTNASLELSGQYLSAYNSFQNKVYPAGSVSLGFQKALTKKWTLNASLEDIFHSQQSKTINDGNIIQSLTKSSTSSRYAVLRFTYRFGSTFDKLKKVNVESNGRL